MKLFKLRKNKLFYKFWGYYIVLIIIPIIILGILNYFRPIRMIEEKNKSFYNKLILESKAIIESKLNYIENISSFLLRNKRIQKVLHDYDKESLDELLGDMDSFYAISELKRVAFINDKIKDISLYINNIDCIINPRGIEETSYYFKNIYSENIIDFSSLINNLSSWNNMYYTYPKVLSINGRDSKVFTFARTSLYNETTINGGIIMYIDHSILSDILPTHSTYGNILTFIIDNKNNIIAGNTLEQNLDTDYAFFSTNSAKIKNDNQNFIVFSADIESMPWKLVMYVPIDTQNFLKYYSDTFFIIVIVFIIVGFIFSLFIAHKNYKPIYKIASALNNDSIENYFEQYKDEYLFIEKKVIQLSNNINKLLSTENTYKKVVSESTMTKLLSSSEYNETEYKEILDIAGLPFKNKNYLVVAFEIINREIDVNTTNLSNKDDDNNNNRLFFKLVSNNAKQYRIKTYYIKDLDDRSILILYWDNTKDSDINTTVIDYKCIENIFINAKYSLDSKRNLIASIGIGTIVTSPKEIACSYSNAIVALSYKIVKNIGNILLYIDVEKTPYQPFYYPISVEMSLIMALKACNIKKVKSILKLVSDENLNKRKLDLYHGKCLYYELYATLIKGLKALNLSYEQIDKNILSHVYCIQDILDLIGNVFENCCIEHNSDNSKITNSVIKFLDDNFLNQKLSLNYVAKELDISPYTISRLFNGNMNTGFQDYINRKRIKYSIQLLKEHDYSVSEICKLSGFVNTHTYIRVFKRYEGVTPGEFKKQLTNAY